MRIMAHKKSCFTTMLRHMFCSGLIVMFELVALKCLATPTISSVTAQQRFPWNGLVDVVVTLQGSSNDVASADCLFAATNCVSSAEIPVEHIVRNGGDTCSETTWTRRFVWDVKADVGAMKIDDVALFVGAKIFGGVQLWEGGPYWAEFNVGATKPEDYGYSFWWGDIVGYEKVGECWNAVDGSRKDFLFSTEDCITTDKKGSSGISVGHFRPPES